MHVVRHAVGMPGDPFPPLLANDAFTVRDALALVPYSRLRRRDVELLARGLRAPRGWAARRDLASVAVLLGPRQHFSHTSAAELWGMPVPSSRTIHTTTVGDGSVTRRPGFVGHRVAPGRARVDMVRGIPVSDRVETWAECFSLLSHEQLVAVGDFLVGRDCGHDLDELQEALRRGRGGRGVRLLREALADVRVGAESPRETRLRLRLAAEGIRPPLLKCEIWHDGLFVARSDIIFGRERTAVEYDGDQHRTDRKTYRDDKRRREALADAGVARALRLGRRPDRARVGGVRRAAPPRAGPGRGGRAPSCVVTSVCAQVTSDPDAREMARPTTGRGAPRRTGHLGRGCGRGCGSASGSGPRAAAAARSAAAAAHPRRTPTSRARSRRPAGCTAGTPSRTDTCPPRRRRATRRARAGRRGAACRRRR